jgi:SAM-dependent methyltransferase
MIWFKRKRPRGQMPGPTGVVSGVHRSPGLAVLCDVLEERAGSTVLDLGPSSTENVAFLAQLGANVQIQDLFRSSGGAHGSRAEIYRFDDVAGLPLPTEGRFDAILVWDLLHYFDPKQVPSLIERLATVSRPGTLLLACASATAPIPPTPIQFKIARRDRLEYLVAEEARTSAPDLSPRRVEKLLPGFQPLRIFQLRNGMQELLFHLRDTESETAASDRTS